MAARVDAGVDLFQGLCGSRCFFGSAGETILKIEKRLAHGIGKGNGSVIDECDFSDPPTLSEFPVSPCREAAA